MYYVNGKIQIDFALAFLAGSVFNKRLPDAPPLSSEQLRAIDVLQKLCRKHSIKLDNQRGDILFANNLSLLHARDAFEDDQKQGKCRHLLRMMLRDPGLAWTLPNAMKGRTDAQFVDGPSPKLLTTQAEWEDYLRVTAHVHGHG